MKPFVHHIDGKAAFLSLENARWQITSADLAVQPFAGAIADLGTAPSRCTYSTNVAIEVRHAHFETVCHRELVGIHEQFVGKRGANFKKLKATELVGVLHLRQQSHASNQQVRRYSVQEPDRREIMRLCFVAGNKENTS